MNTNQLIGAEFSSMHTHTRFCDGKDDVESMCRAAYEKNLYAIGFSAHAPIDKQAGFDSEWNLKDDKVQEYVSEVLAAKKRWQDKLKVFLGYEVDYIKGRRSSLDDDITSLNLDYIIGSVHYIFPENGSSCFTIDGPPEEFERGLKEGFNGDALALMNFYYDAIAEMINLGGFDILGHMDLIKKNCWNKNYWQQEIEIKRQREIVDLLSKTNIIFEINTGGINRKKINDTYPSLTLLRIFREYNIPVIITADAHNANDIIGNYDTAIKMLINANYNDHVLFNGKNNNVPIWQKIKINKF
ncbi:MAG: histidinol-phosphatase [Treponema sp.]|nr:histidinol-phosphatase [Treponema sp.]